MKQKSRSQIKLNAYISWLCVFEALAPLFLPFLMIARIYRMTHTHTHTSIAQSIDCLLFLCLVGIIKSNCLFLFE